MEPDFQDFARVWVGNDQRLTDLVRENPDAAEGLAAKMARALDKRRKKVQAEVGDGGDLVVTIDPSRFGPQGLDSDAWDQLAQMVEEHDKVPPEP
jgi:hypothetical protein